MCAQRRMFSMQIVDTDIFLEMPPTTQNLYFHLGMRADDDGFINNPKKIMKMVNASEDDLKILFAKRFILGFDSGIIVIKHWKMHNYISKDRYHETQYQEEKNKLLVKDNGSYTECIQGCIQDVDSGKVRLGKVSQDKVIYSNAYFSLSKDNYDKYKITYSLLDIDKELRKMELWLDANPGKRKTEKGYPRFINSWLNRAEQNIKQNNEIEDDPYEKFKDAYQ